ncbi:MAG: sugar phosphate isomerase/epimerase [Planctomycetaceae bacterium]|nr:sugar phosphate isomerase/epimerase [Planctomycetaceae bacterium]
MKTTRRNFLATTALTTAGLMLHETFTSASARAAEASSPKYKTRLYKALIAGAPTDENCESWKNAGFDGMEITDWKIPVADARKNRLIAEKHDFYVHSVMRGWAEFNSKDESVVQKTIDETAHAIRIAAAYGAGAILLVPCRVGGMAMPEPWDFDIDFDPKTLMVKSVAEGDNSQYADYIKIQNDSTIGTIKAVEQLIPVAAKEGVKIALENVWNNLWCTPKFAAALVRYFDNPWVKAYFDLGNHTKYSKPQLWIKAFGNTLVKLHIKGYKVTEFRGEKGGGVGDWCPTDQSSTDWKEVRALLDKHNYNGWITVEENTYSPEKYNEILDEFIAG